MADLFVEGDGIRICYDIHGEGYPVVLIHGFGLHKEFWVAQISELANHFKVISLDNRGSGKSDHPKEPYKLETLADDVKCLLDGLSIQKTHVIGWATGAMIAQYLVIRYPMRVNKLVLIAALTKLPVDKSGLEMFKRSQLIFHKEKQKNPENAFFTKMKQRFSRKFYKQLVEKPDETFHGIFTTSDLMDLVFKDSSQPYDIENRINAIAGLNTIDKIHEISNEVLVLAAEKDRISPKSVSIELNNKLRRSKLIIFDGGHYFPLENAPEVNSSLIAFLKD
ncbi:MAG: alpha/beta hydrolase [Candidatus Lokiarchaeota archaeon]|nr:alpha/beta hydrolase [Candidatus Lokiarchaeota archaeon]